MKMRQLTIHQADNGFILTETENDSTEERVEIYEDLKDVLVQLVHELYDAPVHTSSFDYTVELVNTKEHEYTETIVVTRHKALLEYLQEVLWMSDKTKVIEHATEEDVKGKHVIGVLPMHLACHAVSVTEIPLDVPQELRGQELTLEQIRLYAKPSREYKVILQGDK
jgi:putative CRISPR-associated protein (TIGR02620 family)